MMVADGYRWKGMVHGQPSLRLAREAEFATCVYHGQQKSVQRLQRSRHVGVANRARLRGKPECVVGAHLRLRDLVERICCANDGFPHTYPFKPGARRCEETVHSWLMNHRELMIKKWSMSNG